MLKTNIGERAGDVFRYLENNGSCSVSKMKKDLNLKTDDINLALGWLARENKVAFFRKGNNTNITLC